MRWRDPAEKSETSGGKPAAAPALSDEQLPGVRVVQRPQDVGGALHIKVGPKRPLCRDAFDDHPLVRVMLKWRRTMTSRRTSAVTWPAPTLSGQSGADGEFFTRARVRARETAARP
jgi:hypothetical protein